jgi:prevent-host-death family protein
MDTVNASTFKTHFGEVLTKANREPVRITRRGVGSYILIPESEYTALKQRGRQVSARQKEALERLSGLAEKPVDVSTLNSERAQAILAKHARSHEE